MGDGVGARAGGDVVAALDELIAATRALAVPLREANESVGRQIAAQLAQTLVTLEATRARFRSCDAYLEVRDQLLSPAKRSS